MSGRPPTNLLRFFFLALIFILLFSVLWSFLSSGYNQVLAQVARSLVPKEVTIEEKAGTISFSRWVRVGGLKREERAWIDASAIHFGLVLVTALIAATPGLRLRRRFLFMAGAAVTMFALHIATVLVMAKIVQYRGTVGLENDPLQVLFVAIGVDLFPALLWGLFSLKYWFPQRRVSSTPGH